MRVWRVDPLGQTLTLTYFDYFWILKNNEIMKKFSISDHMSTTTSRVRLWSPIRPPSQAKILTLCQSFRSFVKKMDEVVNCECKVVVQVGFLPGFVVCDIYFLKKRLDF